MSHFYCVVVVPKPDALNGEDLQKAKTWTKALDRKIRNDVESAMEPFNENLEIDEHTTECHCIGWIAMMAARKAADEVFGDYDAIREKFRAQHADKLRDLDPFSDEFDKLWRAFTKDRIEFEETFTAGHPLAGKPDPDCETCHGSGEYQTTSNPDAHWDWWRIGGRWCGTIQHREPPPDGEGGFNFADKYEALHYNARSVGDMLDNWTLNDTPFALILPDGSWHERGRMGMFGMASDEQDRDQWSDTVKTLLEQHRDCLAIGCDCHI